MRLCGAGLVLAITLLGGGCATSIAVPGDGGPDGGGGGDGGGRIDGGGGGIDAPAGVEVCDGTDNDGDQYVDEGTAEELCGTVTNGTPKCNGLGGCRIETCNSGFLDIDGLFNTGCECGQEATENLIGSCDGAIDLGALNDDGTTVEVLGNLAPVDDVDYYRFQAVDSADASCDAFHVRVVLLENPGDEFLIEVLRGGCSGTADCATGVDYEWYTDFVDATGTIGECPCGPTAAVNCNDNSAAFAVRVLRAPGKPLSCNQYRLEISNGKY